MDAILIAIFMISFVLGQITGAAFVRYGIGLGAKSAAGDFPKKDKPMEHDYTGGIDEEENLAVQS
jgi:hypothetical protein